jgi:hypothetical protein
MSTMREHLRDLATRGAEVGQGSANMVLDPRVPPGGSQAAKPLIAYGQARGVAVVIREIK